MYFISLSENEMRTRPELPAFGSVRGGPQMLSKQLDFLLEVFSIQRVLASSICVPKDIKAVPVFFLAQSVVICLW